MIFDGNAQVANVDIVTLEHVGHVLRHVHDMLDAVLTQTVDVFGILAVTQKQMRQNFHREDAGVVALPTDVIES